MPTYTPPLRDMRFVIERVLGAPASWAQCGALAECDIDTTAAVLEEAARLLGQSGAAHLALRARRYDSGGQAP